MRKACSSYYSTEIPVDHITDHLPFRSIRKQWIGKCRRVRFSEWKGAEKAIFGGKCLHRSVWDQDAAGSSPVASTKEKRADWGSFFLCKGLEPEKVWALRKQSGGLFLGRRVEENMTVNKPQQARQRVWIITITRYQFQGKTLFVFG